MQEERGFYTVAGVRLEYLQLSPAPCRELTLVLLHEGLGCIGLWKDFPRQLAVATQCRVLAYSRAGYGGSDPCTLPRPLNFMHDEAHGVLPHLLDQAGVDQAVLVGHSDGASIALIYAGDVVDPRLRGLILMAPHVFVEELTLASIRAACRDYQTTGLRQRLARYHDANVDCAFHGWCGAWLDPDFLAWNLEALLPHIQLPVLLLQGEEDAYGTLRQLQTIQRNLPQGATQILLPACGHSPFREQPAATLQAMTAFLQNAFPPSSPPA